MAAIIAQPLPSQTGPLLPKLRRSFGAEIRGVDFSGGVTDKQFQDIQDAVTKVSNFHFKWLLFAFTNRPCDSMA